jgi:2-keto-3-deoxy-L-rhamnonate aldolase RhmA
MKHELGIWNILADQNSTSQLADYFDFIYLDLEHGFRSIDDILATVRFYNSNQVDFSVRVRRFDDPIIQTLLDAGVRKFVLPQLRSMNEFMTFKRSLQFPPNGTRGLHPKSILKMNTPKDESVAITVIIETQEALAILEEIANDNLVTDLYLGVFDLSMEIGVQGGPFSPDLDTYFVQINNVCKKYNKNFVAMLPEITDLSFATKYSLSRVVVGIDSMLIRTLLLQLTSNLRVDQNDR